MKGTYEGMSGEITSCVIVQKDKVPDIVKAMKKQSGVDSYSIDCSSNWLSITLLFLIFALCF